MTQDVNPQDFIALCDLKAKYCRFLDTKDWAGYADLFAEDFELDVPTGGDPMIVRGREAAVRFIRSCVEHATTAHQVHNPEIEVDGDTARATWAMNDRVIWGEDRVGSMAEAGHVGYGHYRERYVRKDGRWRIAASQLRYLAYDPQPKA